MYIYIYIYTHTYHMYVLCSHPARLLPRRGDDRSPTTIIILTIVIATVIIIIIIIIIFPTITINITITSIVITVMSIWQSRGFPKDPCLQRPPRPRAPIQGYIYIYIGARRRQSSGSREKKKATLAHPRGAVGSLAAPHSCSGTSDHENMARVCVAPKSPDSLRIDGTGVDSRVCVRIRRARAILKGLRDTYVNREV